ncbi:hypothetical protein AURDEDRAFT_174771, partial [Auricularia subglabra TFB-10046 SS5]
IKAADKLWRDWAKTDRRKAKEALKEPLTAAGVSLEAFADKEQAEWTGLRPPQGGPRQACPGPRAKVILDEKGVPLAWDVLFEQLQQFADTVEVTTKSKRGRAGTDANTRNKSTSYKRTAFVGERSGCFQLVNLWGAVGHPDDQIGPSADFVFGTVRDFNAAAKLTDQLRVVSKRIDHMLECVDPAQHAVFLIDEFHGAGHTRCSPACFISNYRDFNSDLKLINSSAADGRDARKMIYSSDVCVLRPPLVVAMAVGVLERVTALCIGAMYLSYIREVDGPNDAHGSERSSQSAHGKLANG